MRLIDADALRTNALKATDLNDIAFDNCYPYWQFAKCIKQAPTIDAMPVVCGEWIVDECDTSIYDCPRLKTAMEVRYDTTT